MAVAYYMYFTIQLLPCYSSCGVCFLKVTWQREQLMQIHKNKMEAAKNQEDRVADEDMTTSGGSQG